MIYTKSQIDKGTERYLRELNRMDSKDAAYLAIGFILMIMFLMIAVGLFFKIFGV